MNKMKLTISAIDNVNAVEVTLVEVQVLGYASKELSSQILAAQEDRDVILAKLTSVGIITGVVDRLLVPLVPENQVVIWVGLTTNHAVRVDVI